MFSSSSSQFIQFHFTFDYLTEKMLALICDIGGVIISLQADGSAMPALSLVEGMVFWVEFHG
jgi:hypothetical protein